MAQLFGAIHELTGALTQGTGGAVGWVIKNRGRHAHAFPDEAAGNEARPAPHPIEETTNGPRPGSGAPRASHQSDPGPLAQDCDPNAGNLAQPSQSSDESDRTARGGALNHLKEITDPSASGMRVSWFIAQGNAVTGGPQLACSPWTMRKTSADQPGKPASSER